MVNYQKIIVRMPNWIGDLVMATPILQDLRYAFPRSHITALVQSPLADILEMDPHVNEIIPFKRASSYWDHFQGNQVVPRIRGGKYDLGVLLTNSLSSAWWFWRGGVKQRLGFKGHGRSCLLSTKGSFPENRESQHLVLTYKHLLARMGIPPTSSSPKLYLSESEKQGALRLIPPGGSKLIGINPGAAYGSAKCWLPDRFTAVASDLLNHDPDIRIAFFGDQKTGKMVHSICAPLDGQRVVNLCGKTSLRELMALIAQCDAFLTNDSGPMHIAAALHTPLLALFGSTSEVKTGPYRWGDVIHKHVDCSPCYRRTCPIDFRCMKRISIDEVSAKLIDIMTHSKDSD